MKATLLCAFLAFFLTASYVLGVPDYYGGIGGKGGAGKMYDYDGGMTEGGKMMDEYYGEMAGKMVNGQDGEISDMVDDGRDEIANSCKCKLGTRCPSGMTKKGNCIKKCRFWACKFNIKCCPE